jgi:hypothetical protein
MGRLGFSKFDAKLVLDHNEGRTRDTTDEHYNWEQSLPEKFAGWDNAFLAQILTQFANFQMR